MLSSLAMSTGNFPEDSIRVPVPDEGMVCSTEGGSRRPKKNEIKKLESEVVAGLQEYHLLCIGNQVALRIPEHPPSADQSCICIQLADVGGWMGDSRDGRRQLGHGWEMGGAAAALEHSGSGRGGAWAGDWGVTEG